MEQLIEAFGIDTRLIIIQVFNFGLLMAVLTYFLYKPILKLMAERDAKIKKGVEDAAAAEIIRAEADEEKKGIVAAANKEAEAMAARAKEHASVRGEEIVADARKKAEQVVKDAGMRGQELMSEARRQSEAEIARLAILAAEKVLKERTS